MELILINAAAILIGILMVALPGMIRNLICQTLGALLCLWGIVRIINYFRTRTQSIFGSFGLVQGCAMMGFGVFLLVNFEVLGKIIDIALAIILLITAVFKLQYAFDFMKLKSPRWWIHLIGAIIMVGVGIFALVKPFSIADIALIMVIGCGLIFSGIWDLVSILTISHSLKTAFQQVKKKMDEKDKYVDAEYESDDN